MWRGGKAAARFARCRNAYGSPFLANLNKQIDQKGLCVAYRAISAFPAVVGERPAIGLKKHLTNNIFGYYEMRLFSKKICDLESLLKIEKFLFLLAQNLSFYSPEIQNNFRFRFAEQIVSSTDGSVFSTPGDGSEESETVHFQLSKF